MLNSAREFEKKHNFSLKNKGFVLDSCLATLHIITLATEKFKTSLA